MRSVVRTAYSGSRPGSRSIGVASSASSGTSAPRAAVAMATSSPTTQHSAAMSQTFGRRRPESAAGVAVLDIGASTGWEGRGRNSDPVLAQAAGVNQPGNHVSSIT